MALYREDIAAVELQSGSIKRSFLNHSIGSGDKMANRFGVSLFRDGEPVSAESATVTSIFMAPDGNKYGISETSWPGSTGKEGNKAWVQLPEICYAVTGQFCLAIKLSGGGIEGTMRIIDGTVDETGEAGAVVPTSTIPSTEDIIAAYEEAVEVMGGSVRFDASQSLSDTEKETARENIGAAAQSDVSDLQTDVSGLQTDVSGLQTDVGELQTDVGSVLPAESENILLKLPLTSRTNEGIDFDYISNGVYRVHGTSTANALCALFSNSSEFPDGMQADKYYFVIWDYENIRFEITTYDADSNICTQFVTSTRIVYIPANAVGVRIRLNITSGKTLDTFVYVNIKASEWVDRIIKVEDDVYQSRISFDGGYYIATNGSTADVSSHVANEGLMCAVIDCVGNDLFTINGKGGGAARLYAFIDADGNVLQKAESQEEATEKLIIAPAGSAKLIINSQGTNQTGYGCFKGVSNNRMLEFQRRSLYFDEQDGMSGENHLNGAYWARGYSDYETGIVNPSFDYRVSHYNYVEYPMNIRLHIDPNYTYNAHNTDGELITTSTRKDTVIPANTKFRVNIRRYPEGDNHTPANIDEFVNALQFYVDEAGSIDKYAPTNLDTHTHTVAHRGVPNSAPGNTKPSYVLARQMGLIIAEGDVRFTSDNVAVLAHDATYTVNGVTHTIAQETYEQFMTWDQGAGTEIYEGTYGLSLSAFLDLCNNLGLTPTIEFKVGSTAQIEACLDIIDAKRVKVFNFKASIANLKTIIDHDPYASVRLGTDDYSTNLYNNLVEIINYGQKKHTTHCIYSRYGSWTDEQINSCRAAGAIIGVTSVNSNTALKNLTQDVDIIFTESGFNATMYYTINEME